MPSRRHRRSYIQPTGAEIRILKRLCWCNIALSFAVLGYITVLTDIALLAAPSLLINLSSLLASGIIGLSIAKELSNRVA